jgi:hypothetical protein
MRAAMLTIALAGALVLASGSAASAHGGESVVRLAITGGATATTVRAFVTYVDNDPVVAETVDMRASSGSRHVSMVMKPVRGSAGTYVTTPVLTPGRWRLEAAAQALTEGSATATFTVGADGAISGVHRTSSINGAAPDATQAPGLSLRAVLATLAGLLLAAGVLVLTVRGTRSRQNEEVGS